VNQDRLERQKEFEASNASLQSRVIFLRLHDEVCNVGCVERVAGQHLPASHQSASKLIGCVFEFYKGPMVNRSRVDLYRIAHRTGGFVELRMRYNFAI
jgi:hypothetical protein